MKYVKGGWSKKLSDLVTESRLSLLAARQASESEMRCSGKEHDFIRKAGRLRRWQTSVSEEPSYQGLLASLFYRIREGEAVRK